MTYSDELLHRFENRGMIYILINPSFQDAIIKIGKTSRLSEKRAKELSAATGVPTAFRVLWDETVLDMGLAEKLIHKKLNSQRINPKREFFQLPLKDAVRTVLEVCRDVDEQLLNVSQTSLVIFVTNQEKDGVSAKALKLALQNHLGGSVIVHLFFSSADGKAKCEMTLGDDWKVIYSPHLFSDLQRVAGVSDILLITSSTEKMDDVHEGDGDKFVAF